jgi:hypothetical protein
MMQRNSARRFNVLNWTRQSAMSRVQTVPKSLKQRFGECRAFRLTPAWGFATPPRYWVAGSCCAVELPNLGSHPPQFREIRISSLCQLRSHRGRKQCAAQRKDTTSPI